MLKLGPAPMKDAFVAELRAFLREADAALCGGGGAGGGGGGLPLPCTVFVGTLTVLPHPCSSSRVTSLA